MKMHIPPSEFRAWSWEDRAEVLAAIRIDGEMMLHDAYLRKQKYKNKHGNDVDG
jgi:hypothetical protein